VTWFSLRVESPAQREKAMAALFAAGAQGVHEDGNALVTSFPDEAAARAAAAATRAIDPSATYDVHPAASVNWSTAWRDHVRVVTLGSLTIAPPWQASGLDRRHTVIIDPGMAFGTGDHASTRGALILLQDVPTEGATVADLGSGSAILAIACAKLGASHCWAIEIDPEAQGNATANVDENDVADVVHLLEGDASLLLPLIAPVDLITANIISSVIVDMLPVMSDAIVPGGYAVLSGILESEQDVVVDALRDNDWEVRRTYVEEEWWSALAQRR
jgi:ribosomal protein L11 methyltransferase